MEVAVTIPMAIPIAIPMMLRHGSRGTEREQ
jgi:hypothetical protein